MSENVDLTIVGHRKRQPCMHVRLMRLSASAPACRRSQLDIVYTLTRQSRSGRYANKDNLTRCHGDEPALMTD